MKKRLIIWLLLVAVLFGCSDRNDEDFVNYSTDFYVQMFEDGEQSGRVVKMYAKYTDDFPEYEGDDLYNAVIEMFDGFENGNATGSQVKVMHLLDARQ